MQKAWTVGGRSAEGGERRPDETCREFHVLEGEDEAAWVWGVLVVGAGPGSATFRGGSAGDGHGRGLGGALVGTEESLEVVVWG